jgi:hypothetical protein
VVRAGSGFSSLSFGLVDLDLRALGSLFLALGLLDLDRLDELRLEERDDLPDELELDDRELAELPELELGLN